MVFNEIVRNVIILTKQEKVKEGLYTEGLITGIDFFFTYRWTYNRRGLTYGGYHNRNFTVFR